MWSSPDGYGSISRTYVEGVSLVASGSGFGTVKEPSAAHTACHFASIASGSDRSVSVGSISISSENTPWNEKASRSRGSRESARRLPRSLPGLREKLLHDSHANRHDRPMLALFPDSAALDGASLSIGGLSAGALAE